jgi:hypothetical protein
VDEGIHRCISCGFALYFAPFSAEMIALLGFITST